MSFIGILDFFMFLNLERKDYLNNFASKMLWNLIPGYLQACKVFEIVGSNFVQV